MTSTHSDAHIISVVFLLVVNLVAMQSLLISSCSEGKLSLTSSPNQLHVGLSSKKQQGLWCTVYIYLQNLIALGDDLKFASFVTNSHSMCWFCFGWLCFFFLGGGVVRLFVCLFFSH